jgi:ectoine hydroxylase
MTVISPVAAPIRTAPDKARLRPDGSLPIPRALKPREVARLAAAIDRVYEEEVGRGRIYAGEPMHLLGDIGRDDGFLDLLDHPAVFPAIWGELGWNIHLYHCHLDVTPPRTTPSLRPAWGWHQDGGRQTWSSSATPARGCRSRLPSGSPTSRCRAAATC